MKSAVALLLCFLMVISQIAVVCADTTTADMSKTATDNISDSITESLNISKYTCLNGEFIDSTGKITANVVVGDVITYSYYLQTPTKVVNSDFNINYTSSTLKLVDEADSVRFPLIASSGYFNANEAGVIKATVANISSLIDFTNGGYLFKLSFVVTAEGERSVSTDIDLLSGVNPNGIAEPEITLIRDNSILDSGVTVTPSVEVTDYCRRELAFAGASLTLQNNIAINYMVDKIYFENIGYTDPYVMFDINGKEIKVTEYTTNKDYYIFTFRNLAPNLMNDTITAKLFANYNGTEYSSEAKEYSISEYCYNALELYSNNAKLCTLIVDLLNYGTMSQYYTNYNIDNLANAKLTDTQRAFATADDKVANLTSVTNSRYNVVDNVELVWYGANLNLKDSISIQPMFTMADTTGVVIRVSNADGNIVSEVPSEEFGTSSTYRTVKFSGLIATQLSDTYYFTAYKNGVAISNTLSYSVESYAKAKTESANAGANIRNLANAIMKYGYSSRAYCGMI